LLPSTSNTGTDRTWRTYQGGPFADRSGGLITFVVDEPARAEAAVAGDPFVQEGLLERYWLKEWEPAKS
jgi:uncharacterized protein YciI